VRLFFLFARDQFRQLSHLFGKQLDEVVDRDNPHELALAVDDWNSTDARRAHQADCFKHTILLPDRFELRTHHIAHCQHGSIDPHGHNRYDDVAISDDPDRRTTSVRSFDHQQVTHVIRTHELSSFYDRGIPGRGHDVTYTNFADRHGTYSFQESPFQVQFTVQKLMRLRIHRHRPSLGMIQDSPGILVRSMFTSGCRWLALVFFLALVSFPVLGQTRGSTDREFRLKLYHTHTGERIDITYRRGENYVPQALSALDNFLRDHRTGDVHHFDPRLFDLLSDLASAVGGANAEINIVCGYRTPWSNEFLRRHTSGVAKTSLHMQAEAIDIRLPGARTSDLRRAAVALHRGGVGYYPQSNFVHVDVGRIRYW
jgi:uncharacterized protein YcbK (DUF882 family)